jgi:hypothetical protein
MYGIFAGIEALHAFPAGKRHSHYPVLFFTTDLPPPSWYIAILPWRWLRPGFGSLCLTRRSMVPGLTVMKRGGYSVFGKFCR